MFSVVNHSTIPLNTITNSQNWLDSEIDHTRGVPNNKVHTHYFKLVRRKTRKCITSPVRTLLSAII